MTGETAPLARVHNSFPSPAEKAESKGPSDLIRYEPPETLATEVVDLLMNGANGEVRAKVTGRDAFVVPPIDVLS